MNTDWRKTNLLKEQAENADLYKSVLSKIMTRHKEQIKFNFAATVTQITAKKKMPRVFWLIKSAYMCLL